MEDELRRTTTKLARMSEELVRTRQESMADKDYQADESDGVDKKQHHQTSQPHLLTCIYDNTLPSQHALVQQQGHGR
jgi:hypothetical protein